MDLKAMDAGAVHTMLTRSVWLPPRRVGVTVMSGHSESIRVEAHLRGAGHKVLEYVALSPLRYREEGEAYVLDALQGTPRKLFFRLLGCVDGDDRALPDALELAADVFRALGGAKVNVIGNGRIIMTVPGKDPDSLDSMTYLWDCLLPPAEGSLGAWAAARIENLLALGREVAPPARKADPRDELRAFLNE